MTIISGTLNVTPGNDVSSADLACQFNANRTQVPSEVTVFRSPIIRPGQEFRVKVGSQIVRVNCPEKVRPNEPLVAFAGTSVLCIIEPTDQITLGDYEHDQPLCLAPSYSLPLVHTTHSSGKGLFGCSRKQHIHARLPLGIEPGQVFLAKLGPTQFASIVCPRGTHPGQLVRLRGVPARHKSHGSNGIIV